MFSGVHFGKMKHVFFVSIALNARFVQSPPGTTPRLELQAGFSLYFERCSRETNQNVPIGDVNRQMIGGVVKKNEKVRIGLRVCNFSKLPCCSDF